METINPLDHLSDLAVFVQVVDSQGFSSAARAMGLSKSAISKRINRLEQQLGLRLLQRTTRAMSLTEAGRVLYERAAQGVALLDQSARLAAGLIDAPRGTLRVTASVTFGKLCLASLIPEFLARYPEIELQLTLLDRFVDLVDEGYDVALRLTRTPPEQVVAKALMPVRYRLCSTAEALNGRKIEHPTDLAGHNCLHYGLREFGNEWRFQRGDEEARVSVTSNVVVNNSEVVRDLLLAGLGIGLVWNYAVDREIADGRLLPLLPEWTPVGPFGQIAYALWLPQTHLPPKIRVFVDFLAEHLHDTPTTDLK
ncbi:LysR family transcriptional regulator [Dechloromonas sp. HYN0024]|uniref:LysR family transcriptional regulator n=1 Tax=Dechloromonas sp. HYN0024 TaxID=2231055 RepID=UPI000E43754F|nr:LysR family transcriptional regulator [Dechloromonas sp. HYN0024]AXS79978.1 LysR family transcriptional regulator [Dechloromonas sp. HYN0024]